MIKVNGVEVGGSGDDMAMGSNYDYRDEDNRIIKLNRSCDDISGKIQVSFKNQRTTPRIESSTNTPLLMPKKPCEIDDGF